MGVVFYHMNKHVKNPHEILDPKKVIREFNKRALMRKGVIKVLSDRFGIEFNNKFNKTCNDLIRKHFPKKMNNIVDVGTGMGRLAGHLANKSNRFIGIDFSEKILTVANQLLSDKKNITFIYHDAVDIDFLPQYFDLGIASLILKHNHDKRTLQIIRKMKKWCKKILLIEHVQGGTLGSDISIIRTKEWYLKQFLPLKPIVIHEFTRHNDKIIFCILK